MPKIVSSIGTDRGDPPRGNTVNRCQWTRNWPGDPGDSGHPPNGGIGIALDLKGGRMFLTDLAGDVHAARLDGSGKKLLLAVQGNLTGHRLR